MATKTIFTGQIDGAKRELELFSTKSNTIFIEIESHSDAEAIEIDLATAKDLKIELEWEILKLERREENS
jgi:hypothetical protein